MKKLITLGFAAIAAGMTFAAANDVVITFSTPGPDTYADGTTVLDGERYALCWSQDFSQFSIKSDGTAEGGTVVLRAPLAKDGCCPTTVFEIKADYAAKNFPGGEWAVYLLDTRKFSSNGTASVAGSFAGVNTSGLVGNSVSVGTGRQASLTSAPGAASDIASDVTVPQPTVTGIKVVDGLVLVTVKGTVPYLAYGLSQGATPDDVTETVEDASAVGAVDAEQEITIVTPAKEGGAFLKVKRN